MRPSHLDSPPLPHPPRAGPLSRIAIKHVTGSRAGPDPNPDRTGRENGLSSLSRTTIRPRRSPGAEIAGRSLPDKVSTGDGEDRTNDPRRPQEFPGDPPGVVRGPPGTKGPSERAGSWHVRSDDSGGRQTRLARPVCLGTFYSPGVPPGNSSSGAIRSSTRSSAGSSASTQGLAGSPLGGLRFAGSRAWINSA
jgi:hypothetical protein